MACVDNEVQQIETNFLNALDAVTRFEIQGDVLRLYQVDQPVLTSSRTRPVAQLDQHE